MRNHSPKNETSSTDKTRLLPVDLFAAGGGRAAQVLCCRLPLVDSIGAELLEREQRRWAKAAAPSSARFLPNRGTEKRRLPVLPCIAGSSAVESSRQAGPPVEKGGPADGHRSAALPAEQHEAPLRPLSRAPTDFRGQKFRTRSALAAQAAAWRLSLRRSTRKIAVRTEVPFSAQRE